MSTLTRKQLPTASWLLAILLATSTSTIATAYDCELIENQKVLNQTPSDDDWFGFSTAILGNFAVVGELYGDFGQTDAGAASIYEYRPQTDEWIVNNRISAPTPITGNLFGWSVAMDGDLLVVGAPGVNTPTTFNVGAVFIYAFNGSTYVYQETLRQPVSDEDQDDRFGYSVAIANGRIAVGCTGDDDRADDAGAVYVFVDDPVDGWTQETKLLPSSIMEDDVFGWSVSMSGLYLAVGCPGDDFADSGEGSAFIYEVLNDTWFFREFLTAPDQSESANFGLDVAIHNDGTFLTGAPGDDENGTNRGAAYVYRRATVNTWTLEQKLLASDPVNPAAFGFRVAIEDDLAVVTARNDWNGGSPGSGSVYAFTFDGIDWNEHAKIGASDNLAGNQFGTSVAIDQDLMLVGCYASNDGANDAGSAYFTPIYCPPSVGDLNCDGAIDLGDVEPFALALVNSSAYAAANPACHISKGDMNDDGQVRGDDIAVWLDVLLGQ